MTPEPAASGDGRSEPYLAEAGLPSAVRAAASEFQKADERALGVQTA